MRDVPEIGQADAPIVGRERELSVLLEFVRADPAQLALVLSGGPGIGKTTLWEAGLAAARGRGLRVLSARASEAEARVSFAALIDLLDGVGREELAALPSPQLRALEVALLRTEATDVPPETGAIALGFLNALRALAVRGPLLVAVDDVQWLDPPSAEALAFAVRRLEDEPVGLLLAERPGSPSVLVESLARRRPRRLEVGPLSLGATRRMLAERLGLSLSRQVLRRLFEATLGNPLFALELGRTLAARGTPAIGEDIPVPETVEDLLGTRVDALPKSVRRLLLAVALSGDLRLSMLAAIAQPAAIEEALDAGLLLVDGDRVRTFHPLLAAAAKTRARPDERRELHRDLASVVGDEELRARHLALATEHPDAELAATVAAAAGTASARAARIDAVELAEHALRLTPPERGERIERLLALAGYLEAAGERQRVTDLLLPEVDSLPPGSARVHAWLLLSEGGDVRDVWLHEERLERALAETADDPVARAYVLAKMSVNATACCVKRIRDAEAWALEGLPSAPRSGLVVERLVLHALGWARVLLGQPIDDLCERFVGASDAASYIAESPEPVVALRLLWRGHVHEARELLTRLLSLADERGEAVSYALQRMNLCDLELRAGGWEAASRLLDEWAGSAEDGLLIAPTYERSRALLAAGRGLPDEAERWAASALAGAELYGSGWQVNEALRARGVAALLAHEPSRAAESLGVLWDSTQREGVEEPGAFPVAPDLVEALVELDEQEKAQAVTAHLWELAEQQQHPWGLASARRCTALRRLASSPYDEEAAAELAEAATTYRDLGLRFDEARSLLALGRAQRRWKKWGAARSSLEEAAAVFDELGSPGWAEEARSELERVGARRPRPAGELTPAEQRVAELAADGLSNKEIARTLFVTVNTVEVHLTHAYAKLGVRSRAQLPGRLSPRA